MEGLLFQWDKACDVMPILKPLAKLTGITLILVLLFYIIPRAFLVSNEHRPNPTVETEFDPVLGRYVAVGGKAKNAAAFHNIDPDSLAKSVSSNTLPAPVVVGNIVNQTLPEGIGANARKSLEGEPWDYKVEVAYIVDSGFGRQMLQDNSGVWVDTRDLHPVSRHVQHLTLDPPRKGVHTVWDKDIEVETLRSVVTNCRYYAMEIFGQKRLILGGVGETGTLGC